MDLHCLRFSLPHAAGKLVLTWQMRFGRVNQTAIVVNRDDWKILLWSQPQVFRTLAFRCSVDITATPGWGMKAPDQNLSEWVAEISNTDRIYNNPIYLPNEECYGGDETMKQRTVPAQVPVQSYASKVRQPKGQAHLQHPPNSLGRKKAGTINMTTDQKELDKLFTGVVMRTFRMLAPAGSAASTPQNLQAFVEQQWSALVDRLEQGMATTAVMQGLRSALAELKIAETKAADDANYADQDGEADQHGPQEDHGRAGRDGGKNRRHCARALPVRP